MKLYVAHGFFLNFKDSVGEIAVDIPRVFKKQGIIGLCPVFLTIEDLIKYQGENTSYSVFEVDDGEFVKFTMSRVT